ncbi:pyridoxamine 5'-phosphate oxidase [Streptomyces beihaiensis]|uniref:Pyridoxine/pyridoxamine 5'-phosphate oxidase n=1 Tax=Streptomyces beihaiensis TaxID=2984495 RepID=A0ABT3TRT8_9ACTN|nr:pyridoxamine 5'-phosphate oxidase [Streptomyces beihaiensis]MCX3059741.1 pyridoxamine 5'-phosphate oxidase [Streptomyces beihaiensis]
MREAYGADGDAGLLESDLAPHPMEQFARWFREAAAPGSPLSEPNAMVVSTADAEGRPSSRTVLLKWYGTGVDRSDRSDRSDGGDGSDGGAGADGGFVFYTNYGSRKARDLAANPNVALLFPWHAMSRQVIVTGTAVRTSREETTAYFRSRPHGSQLGAWASAQSTVIASRAELDASYEELTRRYPQDAQVPVPPHWGGYRVTPHQIEFWQGRANRLHDRLRYVRAHHGGPWRTERLSP